MTSFETHNTHSLKHVIIGFDRGLMIPQRNARNNIQEVRINKQWSAACDFDFDWKIEDCFDAHIHKDPPYPLYLGKKPSVITSWL